MNIKHLALVSLLSISASTFAVDSWTEMDSRSENDQEEMIEITEEEDTQLAAELETLRVKKTRIEKYLEPEISATKRKKKQQIEAYNKRKKKVIGAFLIFSMIANIAGGGSSTANLIDNGKTTTYNAVSPHAGPDWRSECKTAVVQCSPADYQRLASFCANGSEQIPSIFVDNASESENCIDVCNKVKNSWDCFKMALKKAKVGIETCQRDNPSSFGWLATGSLMASVMAGTFTLAGFLVNNCT